MLVAFSIGKVLGTQLVALLGIGHVVQGLVMHRKTYLTGNQTFDEGVAVQPDFRPQYQPEEMPGMVLRCAVDRGQVHSEEVGKCLKVTLGHRRPLVAELVGALQLEPGPPPRPGPADCI